MLLVDNGLLVGLFDLKLEKNNRRILRDIHKKENEK